ncbi:MAG TPA: plastocyanin/azurin family copper-binding protein [Gemmatimonadaceae bacterium]
MLSLAAALTLAACGGSSSYSGVTNPPPPPPGPVVTTDVSLKNLAFSPKAIQVSPGATVTFTNNDGIAHNITFSSAAVNGSTDFSTGARTVVMPNATGTYAYHCTIHPGMIGSIVVQ